MKAPLSVLLPVLVLAGVTNATCPTSDFTGDCTVDFEDLLLLGRQWLAWPEDPVDLNGDNLVDLTDLATFALEWRHRGVALFISEVLASNSTSIQDPQGQFDDWIELHNAGESDIDVGGMYLTDDPADPTMWQIPANRPAITTIRPNGYLLIWTDGDTGDSGLHASFRLNAGGDFVALYDRDGQTLLDSVEFDEQTPDISYGRDPGANNQWRFFGLPSPGAANFHIYAGFVADTKFSRDRGFYHEPLSVTITTKTPDAVIYYTTDGSAPFDEQRGVPAGRPYTGPIPIATTTCLRAVAFRIGWMPSNIDTHTYLFLEDVIRQPAQPPGWPTNWASSGRGEYEMDPEVVNDPRYRDTIIDDLKSVPTLSLVTDRDNWLGGGGKGIYLQGELRERPVSAELFFPGEEEGFQVNCAVMIVGGSSTSRWKMDKLSMRLKFKGEYGPSRLRYPVFGDEAPEEFNTLVVDARMNNSWAYGGGVGVSRPGMGQRDLAQYTRDQFAADIHNAMGGTSPRGRHVHLYLNGLYWGLYWLHERPDEHFAASYFGGNPEDYDSLKHNSGRVVNGSATDYRSMLDAARSYEEIQQYLDVPDFMDYMLMNYYIGNTDWAHQNWYASRSRVDPDSRWHYHSWDAEHSLEGLNDNCTGRNDSGGPTRIHHELVKDPEYKMRFADRVHKHFFNNGVLTPEGATALYQIRLDEVDRGVVGESARWGDNHRPLPYTRDVDWVRERDYLVHTYIPQRTQLVLSQLKSRGWYPNINAPSFRINGTYQHGGHVASGDSLSMTGSGGDIWFTLDGTDPRVPGSGSSSDPGGSAALVPASAPKRVLVPTSEVPDAWKGGAPFDDSAWTLVTGSPGGIGYERSSGYESFISLDVANEMYAGSTSCCVRIPFTIDDDPASFNSMVLNMWYDDGFVAYLNGVEIQRALFTGIPRWNALADGNHEAINAEPFYLSQHLNLLRRGENILAIHGFNQSSTSSDFIILAELEVGESTAAEASGVSPTAARYTGPVTLGGSTQVKARVLSGGTWSALNEAVYAAGPVAESLRISEVMYHPADLGDINDPNTEFVELTNVGGQTVDLNLVAFVNGIDFTFPRFDLAPGDYCLVVRNASAFQAKYGPNLNIAGQYAGSLNNAGERIELQDAARQPIHDFRLRDTWYDITDGMGFSLTVKAPATAGLGGLDDKSVWRPSAHVGGSPGYDDTDEVPVLGAVVINELLANSEGAAPDWIELHNTTDRAINIGGWFLSDDADNLTKYEIAEGTSIPAGGYLVFYEDQHFGNEDDPGCHERFALSRDGETVYLHSGSDGVLGGYSEQEKFGASDPSVSLGRYRKSTGTFNFVALSEPTPGSDNADPQVGPVVISEIMYHPDDPADAEYVELLNIAGTAVTLYDAVRNAPWQFTDDPDNPGIEMLLPTDPPVTLGPGERLVLTKDLAVFRTKYTAPGNTQVLAWAGGNLANGNERIQISKPGGQDADGTRHWIRVDRVVYSDGLHPEDFPTGSDPWPAEADGQGASLTRIDPAAYGNDPANWHAAAPSPGD